MRSEISHGAWDGQNGKRKLGNNNVNNEFSVSSFQNSSSWSAHSRDQRHCADFQVIRDISTEAGCAT